MDSKNDASVSRLNESHVPADPSAPIVPTHTAISHRANFLQRPLRISVSDISIYQRDGTAIELWFTIVEPDVYKTIIRPNWQEIWACYACMKIT